MQRASPQQRQNWASGSGPDSRATPQGRECPKILAGSLISRSNSNPEPSADEIAVETNIRNVESKLDIGRKHCKAGFVDCADRIRELGQEREALLQRKVAVQKKYQARGRILSLSTSLMDEYVRQMRRRLRTKKISYRK